MSGPAVVRRSARRDRLSAVAPRVAVYGAVAILSLAGLRGILEGGEAHVAASPAGSSGDLAAEAFAEGFARAWLSYDGADPDARERALSAYLSDELDPDGGYSPRAGRRSVDWTTVAGERVRGRWRTVTVTAGTSVDVVHLAVPVARDGRGFLSVPAYPALVGPPATDTRADPPREQEVEDPGLRTVVGRAVRNYLAGERRDLVADLAPEAVVSLPSERLSLRAVEEVTWVRPGRQVAVAVEATDSRGAALRLRYELAVRRRDRWYVRSLHVDPRQGGGRR